MKKFMTLTVILALSVVLCVVLVSPLHSAPPDWANPGAKPIWKITEAIWIDHVPNPRFAVYDAGTTADESDDVVLDKETGLVWKKIPGTILKNWYDATYECINEDAGGKMGWRQPTVEELLSLREGTGLPTGHPFSIIGDEGTQPSYWSSTTDIQNPDAAYPVCFPPGPSGCLYVAVKNSAGNYVWCVRGGYGYDAY